MFDATATALLFAFWPFASGWMLLWGFAALIPILIHFLSRRRYDEVPWAAMEFLLAAIRKHARRWRLEQLLLLVLRASILVLLAVALADPVWSLLVLPRVRPVRRVTRTWSWSSTPRTRWTIDRRTPRVLTWPKGWPANWCEMVCKVTGSR